MIKDILKSSFLGESLNESQLIDIENAFNEAVELKAAQVADDIIAEKEISLKESYADKEAQLVEKFEDHTAHFEQKMIEKLDGFINSRIDAFISKSHSLLEAEVDASKSRAILSIFDNMIRTAGVSAAKLVEGAKGEHSVDYDRISEKYDAIASERQRLIDKLVEYRKQALIDEYAEGLGLVSAEKFKRVATLVLENEDDEDIAKEKLANLKKSAEATTEDDEVADEEVAISKGKKKKKPLKESYHARVTESRRGTGIDWTSF